MTGRMSRVCRLACSPRNGLVAKRRWYCQIGRERRARAETANWRTKASPTTNDGIISTASLIVGVVAAAATRNDVLIAGVAGLVAGAMSMSAGEYVSVSSQSECGPHRARLTQQPYRPEV